VEGRYGSEIVLLRGRLNKLNNDLIQAISADGTPMSLSGDHGLYDASRSCSRYRGAISQGKTSVVWWASHTCAGFSIALK
jgi:hypothetical protein